jgi:hypothetical protein
MKGGLPYITTACLAPAWEPKLSPFYLIWSNVLVRVDNRSLLTADRGTCRCGEIQLHGLSNCPKKGRASSQTLKISAVWLLKEW